MNVFDRVREAYRVFRGRDRPDFSSGRSWGGGSHVTQFDPRNSLQGGFLFSGPSSSVRPDRVVMRPGNEKTIINAAYNRIALDVASVEFHHAKIDENENFQEVIPGSIEDALRVEANIDQTPQAYTVDLVMSMFDEGVVAEVPVLCDIDEETGKITDEEPLQLRLGKIVEWRPQEVRVNVYNEGTGFKEDIPVLKRETVIIENPFYSVMNQRNSIFQRLARKMALLDFVNEKQGSDKLNMILQLPYIVRTDVQRKTANARLEELEAQLGKSNLGIGYVDGTEKIIQLNRPIETNLQNQIEWLTKLFFSQLCITEEILNGTADPKTMSNYMQRCVGVICTAIVQERRRKLLTAQQRADGESIVYVQDPFKLIPITELADLMDKSIRSAIMSPNDWRSIIGYKPSDDPQSNMLVNRSMPLNQTPEAGGYEGPEEETPQEMQQSAVPRLNRNQRRKLARQKKKELSG